MTIYEISNTTMARDFIQIDCSPLYCSADENQLLIKHDQEDCYQIVTNW